MINEEESYKLNRKNKTDHNLIIIEIIKNTSIVKKKIENKQWKINSNTNWTRFRKATQNNIINNKARNYEELEKIITQLQQKKVDYLKIKVINYIQTKK